MGLREILYASCGLFIPQSVSQCLCLCVCVCVCVCMCVCGRGGQYQVFSVRYDTEYFTFYTVDTILFSIQILNKHEASIQDKRVDNIYIHIQTDKLLQGSGSRTRTC